MKLTKLLHTFAISLVASLGIASQAEAAVGMYFSTGATCAGASATAAYSPAVAAVDTTLLLCASTSAGEPLCAHTTFLQSAAGESGRFAIQNRVPGPLFPTELLNEVYPYLINNPNTAPDFGSFNTNVQLAGADKLLATFTLRPQAGATANTYVISTVNSSLEVDTDGTCGNTVTTAPVAQASITMTLAAAPTAFSSATSTSFTANVAGTFTVVANGSPAPTYSIIAGGALPGTVALNLTTGVLAGIAPAIGVFGPYTIRASNPSGNITQSFTLNVVGNPQTITFAQPASTPFSAATIPSGATSDSGLAVTLTSTTASVCTITPANSLNITMVSAGSCTINANQGGGSGFAPAAQVQRTFAITPVAPGAPSVVAVAGNNLGNLTITAPAFTGGTPITSYTVVCNPNAGTDSAVGTAALTRTISALPNGTSHTCAVTATGLGGTGAAGTSNAFTPSPTPVTPIFTSAAATTFTVGAAGTFTVTATGTPTPTFGATIPVATGGPITLASLTGVLSGTPTTAGVYTFNIAATSVGAPTPTVNQSFTLTVAKANQTITFGPIANQPFNASPFALTGTASSLLALSYSSSTTAVCTVTGASVTFLAAGTCTITASQAGSANYNAAPAVPAQSFTITASVPGAPTIGTAQPGNLQAFIGFTPPAATGGSPILDYTATCTGGAGGTATGTTSPIQVTALTNGTLYTCSVTARNVTGSSAASGTTTVTPAPITAPGAPTIGGASPGNGLAIVTFTAPASNGGSAITSYTASCVTGALPAVTGTAASSPVTVMGLTNGSLYNCTVTATNIQGTGLPSASASVTPRNVPIALTSNTQLATYGASVVLLSSVTGNNQTGTVAFSVNTSTGLVPLTGCAAVPLVVGFASCVAPGSFQNQNPRTYVAAYSGDASNAAANISFDQRVLVGNASLSVSANPLPPAVTGRTATLTALVKMSSPVGTVTFFDNAVPITGCAQLPLAILPDAVDSAVANCTVTVPASASGTKTYVATYFYPAGHASGRTFEQTNLDLRVIASGPADYTDMWWAGVAENGWGVSISQHGAIQFNVIFAYDAQGKPLWYVMSRGVFNAGGTVVTGELYQPTSSPFSAYNVARLNIGPAVGSATITYTSSGTATLAYTINGVSATKSIQRQVFSNAATGPNLFVNDIWWATAAENGWGINIAQQGRVLFPVWYTYNAGGTTTFFTGQDGRWNGTVWSGTLYATTSSAWLGVPYVASSLVVTSIGSVTIDFTDASNATFTYTNNGVTQTKHIERQPF